MINVRDRELAVDVLEELAPYELNRAEIKGEKLIACSPFRNERRPSFAVHLIEGTYIDSGGTDYWRKGNFQKLLSFLSGLDVLEIEDYLIQKYSPFHMEIEKMELNLNLIEEKPSYASLTEDSVSPYKNTNHYLLNERGLKEEVLKRFNVGYEPATNSSVFVWRDKNGKVVNFKFRKNDTKKFFYLQGGEPIKNHIYNFHEVVKNKIKKIYITESEIDALYINGLGEEYMAVALGGANLSKKQEELLKSSSVREIVLCFDNDEAGERIKKYTIEKLMGIKELFSIYLPENIKDVNELDLESLEKTLKTAEKVGFSF